MFYNAIRNDHGLAVDPFNAIVAPRPIGWISTLAPNGIANLAPYSYFNAMSRNPHYVVFGSDGYKDSLRNIEATREFAVNMATFDLRDAMNATSASAPPNTDEFELAGLAKSHCQLIKVPRVAASPACLECKLHRIIELPDDEGKVSDWMVVGRVIGIHIDDRFIEGGRVNTAAMQPIARMGYSEYVTANEAWRIRRPD
jgi:flavin reductase (DIM6/NTAB) family NADH-FMN oxidoreductase RutF